VAEEQRAQTRGAHEASGLLGKARLLEIGKYIVATLYRQEKATKIEIGRRYPVT
jgi:hypothetical protein